MGQTDTKQVILFIRLHSNILKIQNCKRLSTGTKHTVRGELEIGSEQCFSSWRDRLCWKVSGQSSPSFLICTEKSKRDLKETSSYHLTAHFFSLITENAENRPLDYPVKLGGFFVFFSFLLKGKNEAFCWFYHVKCSFIVPFLKEMSLISQDLMSYLHYSLVKSWDQKYPFVCAQ